MTHDESSRDDDTGTEVSCDKENVAPPTRFPAKVGGRVESIHVDLLGLSEPARDDGRHDGQTRSDEYDKDGSDVQAHVVVLKQDSATS